MKQAILLLIILINKVSIFAQEIPVPANYSIIDTISGDLDRDRINELVVAYNTRKENSDSLESIPRELIIYKKQKGTWAIWKKSSNALYGSRDGGMMGDPFGEIKIKNGILEISHDGGSSWKWGHTDKYRYQNGEFELIGYSSVNGKLCEYWQKVDFNLSTGKMVIRKEFEECETSDQHIYKKENETFYKMGLKITIQNRSGKEIKFVSPKYKHEIYIATKNE